MTTEHHLARIGAVAAVIGSAVLFAATMLHPMSADPSDPTMAFAEYAADALWVGSHLQPLVWALIVGAVMGRAARSL